MSDYIPENYAYNLISKIIEKFDGRTPGSINERRAAEYIANELSMYCDKVEIEEFELHPGAFLGFINIVFVLIIIAIVTYDLIPIISFVSSIIGAIITFMEFFHYAEFVDPLFPKKKSCNVIGRIKVGDNIKRRIIVSGHHDSAYEFRLLSISPYLYMIAIFSGLSLLALLLVWDILWIAVTYFPNVSSIVIPTEILLNVKGLLKFVIYALFVMAIPLIFFKSKKGVPGAVDNLSSVGVLISVAKSISQMKDKIPEGIEVLFISFGAEEAGLRGSRRFVQKHLNELKSVRTYAINMEMIADPSKFAIAIKEKTTRTKHSIELASRLKEIGEKIGIVLPFVEIPFIGGGTDAVSFSRNGVPAVTLFGTSFSIDVMRYYHTMRDTIDKINPKALKIAHDLIINTILKL